MSGLVVEGGVRGRRRGGFTLIELLVVMGIITILVAMMLPAIMAARRQCNTLVCASNLRQIDIALVQYAVGNKGRFPPNFSAMNVAWYDPDRLGTALKLSPTGRGRIVTCPEDPDGGRSYAMNVWASAFIDPKTSQQFFAAPRLLRLGCGPSSSLMLMGERWSTVGPAADLWAALPTVGQPNVSAARRFGWNGGVIPSINAGRWGLVTTEIAFNRHRNPLGPGKRTEAIGRANFLFLDGHVALVSSDDLYTPEGIAKTTAMWDPANR